MHSRTYYVVRTIVRAIVHTAIGVAACGFIIAGAWIVWAAFGR